MDKASLRVERSRLQEVLDKYESGRVTHYDEDEKGELKRDVTAERIASIRAQIKDIDRMLAEDWRD